MSCENTVHPRRPIRQTAFLLLPFLLICGCQPPKETPPASMSPAAGTAEDTPAADPVLQEAVECRRQCIEYERQLQQVFTKLEEASGRVNTYLDSGFLDGPAAQEEFCEAARTLRLHGQAIFALYEEHNALIDQCIEAMEDAPDTYLAAAYRLKREAEMKRFEDTRRAYNDVAEWWRQSSVLVRKKRSRLPLRKQQIALTMDYIREVVGFLADFEASIVALPGNDEKDMLGELLTQIQQFGIYFKALDVEIVRSTRAMQLELDTEDAAPSPELSCVRRPTEMPVDAAVDTIEPLVVLSVLGNCAIFAMPAGQTLLPGDQVQIGAGETFEAYAVLTVGGDLVTVHAVERNVFPTLGATVQVPHPRLPAVDTMESDPVDDTDSAPKKEPRLNPPEPSDDHDCDG